MVACYEKNIPSSQSHHYDPDQDTVNGSESYQLSFLTMPNLQRDSLEASATQVLVLQS